VLPDVKRWLGKTVPWIPLSFHMTQALTEHGCFQKYLHRMGRAASPRCHYCGHESDSASHTLFDCPFFNGHREELSSRLQRRPSAEDLPDILCGPVFDSLPGDEQEKHNVLREAEEDFRLLYRMVESILKSKEGEERIRQAAEDR